MDVDIRAIPNPQVRQFYALYWPQRQILYDFFSHLTEEQFDFQMVAAPDRKSDTPRQSLAHLLYVQLVYWNGVRSKKLEFGPMGVEHYWKMTRPELLEEWERIDTAMLGYLTSAAFDSTSQVTVFWGGEMNPVDVLFFLRDHAILHIGWNLALMDHLRVPRFPSLIQYWGP